MSNFRVEWGIIKKNSVEVSGRVTNLSVEVGKIDKIFCASGQERSKSVCKSKGIDGKGWCWLSFLEEWVGFIKYSGRVGGTG